MRRSTLFCVSLFLGCLAPMAVSAQALTPLDRYWVAVGVYHSDNNLTIRVDGEDTVAGTNVNFQEDLGLGDEELAFVYDVGMTLGRNHQIAVTGHRYDNSAHNTLERELDIDDESYAIGAAFQATWKWKPPRFPTLGSCSAMTSTRPSAWVWVPCITPWAWIWPPLPRSTTKACRERWK